MADGTAIEWTHQPGTKGETWNPIAGCSVVSPGCANCYAMRRVAPRLSANPATPHYAGTVKPSRAGPVWTGKIGIAAAEVFTKPLRWKSPRTIFVNSTSDLFHEDVPDEVIDRVFAVMALSPRHTFQVLTKRSTRMRAYINGMPSKIPFLGRMPLERIHLEAAGHMEGDGGVMDTLKQHGNIYSLYCSVPWPLPNVWLGVSAERQTEADQRIPDLLATPAAIRFVSAEPLLGPIDFARLQHHDPEQFKWLNYSPTLNALTGNYPLLEDSRDPHPNRLDWIIVGGESGNGARPMHPDWARSIRDQCAAAAVPFFFKQWGAWLDAEEFLDRIEAGPSIILRDGERWTPRRPLSFADAAFLAELTNNPCEHQSDGRTFLRMRNKAAAGRLLGSREHNGMPQPREIPAL